jgi:hypothetical protein
VKLFLWKLRQDVNNDYDTYDSAVVVASSPMLASQIHPALYSDTGKVIYYFDRSSDCWRQHENGSADSRSWVQPNDVQVTCIGEAASWLGEGAVVCSSYNAG